MKKTIEEVAEEYADNYFIMQDTNYNGLEHGFLAGAKYQSEQMYSYEDLGKAFMACWIANMPEGFECKLSFIEWFNKFKKND